MIQNAICKQPCITLQTSGRCIHVVDGFIGDREVDLIMMQRSNHYNEIMIGTSILPTALDRLLACSWWRVELRPRSKMGVTDAHVDVLLKHKLNRIILNGTFLSSTGWLRLGWLSCWRLTLIGSKIPPNTINHWNNYCTWKYLNLYSTEVSDFQYLYTSKWTTMMNGNPVGSIPHDIFSELAKHEMIYDEATLKQISIMNDNDKNKLLDTLTEMKVHNIEKEPFTFKVLTSDKGVVEKQKIIEIYNKLEKQMRNLKGDTSEKSKLEYQLSILESIPLHDTTKTDLTMESIKNATLDNVMFGQEKAKLRLKLTLAQIITMMKKETKVSITPMLFTGPPGVGKTMLCKEVGNILGMPIITIPLASATDPKIITGHMSTYVGSRPGVITSQYIQGNSTRVVFHLDEIEKAAMPVQETLIHLLDQTTNSRWKDDYFPEMELDLSQCVFICTCNNMDTIHPILRNRLQTVIKMDEYTKEEKGTILKCFIWEKVAVPLGVTNKLTRDGIMCIVEKSQGTGMRSIQDLVLTIAQHVLLREYKEDINQAFVQKCLQDTGEQPSPSLMAMYC